MKKSDGFGNRMKKYENAFRHHLPERMPVIIRIDGSHFHTYTKGLKKPFDKDLANAFWETSKYLLKNISGAKLAYHQSDEISLLLTNYDKLQTQSWFENNLQKLVSVSASLATAKFNDEMRKTHPEKELATFDARAYVIPKEEVNNYFLWRERDAMKNSISMVAQQQYSTKELKGLNGKEMKKKLWEEKGIDYDDLPTWQRQGVIVKKEKYELSDTHEQGASFDELKSLYRKFEHDYVNLYRHYETVEEMEEALEAYQGYEDVFSELKVSEKNIQKEMEFLTGTLENMSYIYDTQELIKLVRLLTKSKARLCMKTLDNETTIRKRWTVDFDIPVFSEDPSYIEQFVFLDEK